MIGIFLVLNVHLRIGFRSDSFNIENFKIASRMFIGSHDFRSFMQYSKEEKTVRSSQKLQNNLFIDASILFSTRHVMHNEE